MRKLLIFLALIPCYAWAGEKTWIIQGPAAGDPAAPPKTQETSSARPPTNTAEALGVKSAVARPESEIAAAFGLNAKNSYKKDLSTAGKITKGSLLDVLKTAYPDVAASLPSFSQCGGKEFLFATSNIAKGEESTNYSVWRQCDGTCLSVVEVRNRSNTLLSLTPESSVDARICAQVFGGGA